MISERRVLIVEAPCLSIKYNIIGSRNALLVPYRKSCEGQRALAVTSSFISEPCHSIPPSPCTLLSLLTHGYLQVPLAQTQDSIASSSSLQLTWTISGKEQRRHLSEKVFSMQGRLERPFPGLFEIQQPLKSIFRAGGVGV